MRTNHRKRPRPDDIQAPGLNARGRGLAARPDATVGGVMSAAIATARPASIQASKPAAIPAAMPAANPAVMGGPGR